MGTAIAFPNWSKWHAHQKQILQGNYDRLNYSIAIATTRWEVRNWYKAVNFESAEMACPIYLVLISPSKTYRTKGQPYTGLGTTSDLYQSIWRTKLNCACVSKEIAYLTTKITLTISLNSKIFPLPVYLHRCSSSIVYVHRQGDKGLFSYYFEFLEGNSECVPEYMHMKSELSTD